MKPLTIPKLNRCDFFLLGWVAYYLQGILFEEGGLLSTGLLFALLFVSLIYTFKTYSLPNKPYYFKGLVALIILFTVYGIAHILFNPLMVNYRESGIDIVSYNYIKAIYLSLLPIFPFYYFSRIGYLNDKRLIFWFFVFIVSCTLTFLRTQRDVMLEKGLENITNNSGYLMLSLLPGVVLFRKKPLVQFCLLAYILFFLVIGMKRGAILIAAVTLPFFFFEEFKKTAPKQKFIILLFLVIFVSIGVRFIQNLMDTNEYFMLRVLDTAEGNSSGRDSVYSFFWDYFLHKNTFLTFLFGNGANHTLEVYDMAAHNDWLEIAINQGLLGVVFYLFYWFGFLKTWLDSSNLDARLGIAIVGVVFFLKTFFSMSYSEMSYVSTCVFGYYLAVYKSPNK